MSPSFGTDPQLKIIIVGAGICGLLTAIQLERAGIDYLVVEKALTPSPLGSGLSLTPACNYILDQLGLLDEIHNVSLPCAKIDYIRDDLSNVGVMNSGSSKSRYGYDGILIARPTLYQVLLSHVPKEKVLWGKRMVGFHQDQDNVEIQCQETMGTQGASEMLVTFKGHILIGADGAYSSVRSHLYENMAHQEICLPKDDLAPLRFDSDCVVGTTEVLSEEDYPIFKEKSGDFFVVIGKEKAIQVYLLPFAERRIGWYICGRMDTPEVYSEKDFKFNDWKPVAADELLDVVRDYKSPFGGNLGDIFNATPKERLSKVMLQDKYFSTWYHQRTVLMGDACHKHLPFGGMGGNQAILDSVHLVNQLVGLPSTSLKNIELSFKTYYENRSQNAKDVFKSASMVASLLSSRGIVSDFMRFLALKHLPESLNNIGMDGMNSDRPYLCFLPPPTRGNHASVPARAQPTPVHYKGQHSLDTI